MEDNETFMTFPCDFSIKAIGKSSDTIETTVLNIIRNHAERAKTSATQASSGGKYTSITVTFQATSQQQLDKIYQQLGQEPDIHYVL